LGGGLGEEIQEKLLRFLALAPSGFEQAVQDAVVLQTFVGASALDDFAHDDHRPQTAFGLVVGGRDVGPTEAGKEVLLFRSSQALAKSLGSGIAQSGGTQGAQLSAQGAALAFGGSGAPRPLAESVVSLAGLAHKRLDVLTKALRLGSAASRSEGSVAVVTALLQ
jgi:hypothetical protein